MELNESFHQRCINTSHQSPTLLNHALVPYMAKVSLSLPRTGSIPCGGDGVLHLELAQLLVDGVHPPVPPAPRAAAVHEHDDDAVRAAQVVLPAYTELLRHQLRSRGPVSRDRRSHIQYGE